MFAVRWAERNRHHSDTPREGQEWVWSVGVVMSHTYLEVSHEGTLVALCFTGAVVPLAGSGEGGEGEDMGVHRVMEQVAPPIINTA